MRAIVLGLCLSLCSLAAAAAGPPVVVVSAAVSLKEALSAASQQCQIKAGVAPRFNFGASGHLLAQIREGAPVDVFVAASDEQMDHAQALGLIHRETRVVVGGNEMVLIVPSPLRGRAEIASFDDLTKPSVRRIAIGQPKTVPAGMYATQVLDHLKLTAVLADRIVYGSSVRQVLDYAARGEVDAGIVYATDAREAGDAVRVVAHAQPSWHDPIRYVAAVTARSKDPAAAKRFVDFLRGETAQRSLADFGFTSPGDTPATRTATATAPATQPASVRSN